MGLSVLSTHTEWGLSEADTILEICDYSTFDMKSTAGDGYRGGRSFLVRSWSSICRSQLPPTAPQPPFIPLPCFSALHEECLCTKCPVQGQQRGSSLPNNPPPPLSPDSVDESELVIGTAQGLGTSSGWGVEEFFQAAKQRGVCGRRWLCPLPHAHVLLRVGFS